MDTHIVSPSPPDEHGTLSEATQCLAAARIVLRDGIITGAVHLEGKRIVGITEGSGVPAGAENLCGDYLLPGLVELHTDNLEHHIRPRPKVDLPHITAILAHDGELASVGITTVFDALRVGSLLHSAGNYAKYARSVASEILEMRAQGLLRARHLLHLRAEICSETLIDELDEFSPEDRVGIISLMDHTPGQRQFRDMAKLKQYLAGKHSFSDDQYEEHIAHRHSVRARVGDVHEIAAVDAAHRLGATLASHDDTTADQVRHSKRLSVTLGEFPTTVEAAEACREAGIKIIIGAPNLIRGGSHSGNVSALELAERGLVDIVSSDYVPSLLMDSAFKLAALWEDLPRAVQTVATTPADTTGLTDRGRIAEGCLGDLVQVHAFGSTPVVRAVWRGGKRVC